MTGSPGFSVTGEQPLPRLRLEEALTPRQLHAARQVIATVRSRVAADLVHASLFGSRARGDARPDSDLDLLLIFRHLPPGREPFAGQAEAVAERIAARWRVPVSVWSVSLIDLVAGHRTPMLVDALADAIPMLGGPLAVPIHFSAPDALHCTTALLQRAAEGSTRVASLRAAGRPHAAARRTRDDLVRLCVAAGLLEGITRPRRAEAVRGFIERERPPSDVSDVLEWAERSFGTGGTDDRRRVALPPGGFAGACAVVEALRRGVARRRERLRRSASPPTPGKANAARGMDFALGSEGLRLVTLASRSRTRP